MKKTKNKSLEKTHQSISETWQKQMVLVVLPVAANTKKPVPKISLVDSSKISVVFLFAFKVSPKQNCSRLVCCAAVFECSSQRVTLFS